MDTVTLKISGMACGGCANTVTQALMSVAGVVEANVSHAEGRAEIRFDPELAQLEQLKSAVERAGYQVTA